MKKLTYIFALLLSVASCVYPFEMETGLSDGRLAVTGDIILGEKSTFTISRLQPLGGDTVFVAPSAEVRVESSAGRIYKGILSSPGCYVVDMTDADKSQEYRFCASVRFDEGTRNYSSEWLSSPGECRIDSLYYYVDDMNRSLCFAADLSSDGGCRYYDLSYQETWEYCSDLYATHYYIPSSESGEQYGVLERYLNGENVYYCWNSRPSRGLVTVGTEDMVSGKVTKPDIVRMSEDDRRISICYRLDLRVHGLSEDAYRYRSHMSDMSSYQGDLFSPTPSEIRGNIRCAENDDEQVAGYVSVTSSVSRSLYEIDSAVKFYKARRNIIDNGLYPEEEWPFLYQHGMLAVGGNPSEGYYWAKDNCVDCRLQGGSKTIPEGWPTGHK